MTNVDMGAISAKPDMGAKINTGAKTNIDAKSNIKVDSNAKLDSKPKATTSAKPADSQTSKTGAEGSVKMAPKPATMTAKPGKI